VHRARLVVASITALALSAMAAASSPAATTPLGGHPLNVYVGDFGQLQAFRDGVTNGIFYAPRSPEGDAGFFIADRDNTTVYGFNGRAGPHAPPLVPYTIGSQSPVTGSGSAADPLKLTTTYTVPLRYEITQTTTYVSGSQEFRIRWDVKNISGATRHFKALAAADFYFDGSDRGTGIFTQGPPRFIGGTNADTGNSGGFAEVLGSPSGSPAWSSYQALAYGSGATQVWGKVQSAAAADAATFDTTVVGQQVDNAGGVEWDQNVTPGGLADGATTSFELVARNAVASALQITPTNAGAPKGVPINFTVTAVDSNGQPYTGKTIRYSIVGVNPGANATTVAANGTAVITDPGTNAGADTVVAFLDFNNNGTREAVEPQASALATFVDSVPPSCTVKVTGDRPGGGGAGKPLIITVNCGEAATVTVQTTLQPTSASARAASIDKKKKKKKHKKVIIKLKTSTVTVAPGTAVPVSFKITSAVRKKYAGKKLKATITVTARDASGNVKTTKVTRTIKLAAIKHKRH
jgi:hypothetical protein